MQAQGYLKGRPRALYVLDYGLFRVHANGRVIGICGFLIETEADEYVLVDTGSPEKYARDKEGATQEDRLYEFGEVLSCDMSNTPAAQLALAGIRPEQITLHIITHTHIDHVGHISAFPQAPILIAGAERRLQKPLYWGDVQPLEWPDQSYLVIEEDVALGPGCDILMAPGHAPGQIAMLLDMPETGSVLLTSDAISRPAEIDEKFAGSWDEELAIKSAVRLMALAQEHDAFVIYGHCPAQWPKLRKAPESYH
jgi:N-acyl homoserine lactone hydrolase